MLPDGNRMAASSGSSRAHAHGKGPQKAAQQAPVSANGTHKPTAAKNGSSKVRQPSLYHGHDREEVTRILIQALTDMGYQSAAQSVSQDSGYELEGPTVASFRNAVLGGDWTKAEDLLSGASIEGDGKTEGGNGLVLTNKADRDVMRFWVRQQKFLELLERKSTSRALAVLRNELTPLYQEPQKLHLLSSLVMCTSAEDLKQKAAWDGESGQSRRVLLSELSKCISPSVMLPEKRLAVLLQQVKQNQIGMCLYHSVSTSPSLYADHVCDRCNFPTDNILELHEHQGEVWQLSFSHDGKMLASCGSDGRVIIWDVPSFKIAHILGGHEGGVGNVAWSPDDKYLVTCCTDQQARLWDTKSSLLLRTVDILLEPATSCVWAPDGRTFVIGSLDKSCSLSQWSLEGDRVHDWEADHRVEDLALSPDGRWLVAKDDRNRIHVYNYQTRELEYEMELANQLYSISISRDSRHLLMNQSNGVAQLIDLANRVNVQSYTGHLGGDFVIRATLGGANESFVVSGSEDGHVHIWHKASATVIEKLPAHRPRCNAVVWCPTDPFLLASCGDDGKIKIWSNSEWLRVHQDDVRRHKHERELSANGWRTESRDS